jgi:hypothetical protein
VTDYIPVQVLSLLGKWSQNTITSTQGSPLFIFQFLSSKRYLLKIRTLTNWYFSSSQIPVFLYEKKLQLPFFANLAMNFNLTKKTFFLLQLLVFRKSKYFGDAKEKKFVVTVQRRKVVCLNVSVF